MSPTPRIHVWPWLRRAGKIAVPNWLAITIGRHIFSWRTMTEAELSHELMHVRQWAEHGWRFPFLYLAESLRARRRGHWYRDNRFEVEARGERTRA